MKKRKAKEKKMFLDIRTLTDDKHRSFQAHLHCIDSKGTIWTLRAQGDTAGEAATAAWETYILQPEIQWHLFGFITPTPCCSPSWGHRADAVRREIE